MIIDRITSETGLDRAYLSLIANTATHRYKTYKIPKRTGGYRTIDHPARELKLLQTWLVENVFCLLPIHPAAVAYRKGKNITDHASVHVKHNYLLKTDFADFFPSISGDDVVKVLKENSAHLLELISSPNDHDFVRRVICKRDCLTIGAPSSPIVSNVVMYNFDREWSSKCDALDVSYSRYADDICFSTDAPNTLADLLLEMKKDLLRRTSPRLRLNEKKTVFTSRKRRRLIPGLVLTSDRRLSLGRKPKRQIRALVFRCLNKQLAPDKLGYLRGFLSYARSVDKGFVDALRRKYGANVMDLILRQSS